MLKAILLVCTIFERIYLIFCVSALPGVILSLTLIWIIGKLVKNNSILKRLVYVIIALFCIIVSIKIFFSSKELQPYVIKIIDAIGTIGEYRNIIK